MNATRTSPLEGIPDRYDGVAAIVALAILGWAFLYAIQPVLGTIIAFAVLSVYAVGRTADYVHTSIVIVSWIPVFVGLFAIGLAGVFIGSIMGILIYALGTRSNSN